MKYVLPLILISVLTGCSHGKFLPGLGSPSEDWKIKKVSSKWKTGVEDRENSGGQHANRWTAQVGLEAETYNGHKFGISYRRRDMDRGSGVNDGHDDGVWISWSIPLWKDTSRPSKEKLLERRVAALEASLAVKEAQQGSINK